jgi:hypothetical protein
VSPIKRFGFTPKRCSTRSIITFVALTSAVRSAGVATTSMITACFTSIK